VTTLKRAWAAVSVFAKKVWALVVSLAKKALTYVVHHPLALAATVALLVAAIVLLAAGRTFQIGGLLQRLWGIPQPPSARGIVPSGRTDSEGKPIEPGQSDDKGYVQAPVSTAILPPGILSDPSTVTVVHPDKGRVTVQLPDGVKNTDVKEVVEVAPDVYEVRNNDTGVKASDLDGLLGKIDKN